jgi:hypothetical protein
LHQSSDKSTEGQFADDKALMTKKIYHERRNAFKYVCTIPHARPTINGSTAINEGNSAYENVRQEMRPK